MSSLAIRYQLSASEAMRKSTAVALGPKGAHHPIADN